MKAVVMSSSMEAISFEDRSDVATHSTVHASARTIAARSGRRESQQQDCGMRNDIDRHGEVYISGDFCLVFLRRCSTLLT